MPAVLQMGGDGSEHRNSEEHTGSEDDETECVTGDEAGKAVRYQESKDEGGKTHHDSRDDTNGHESYLSLRELFLIDIGIAEQLDIDICESSGEHDGSNNRQYEEDDTEGNITIDYPSNPVDCQCKNHEITAGDESSKSYVQNVGAIHRQSPVSVKIRTYILYECQLKACIECAE